MRIERAQQAGNRSLVEDLFGGDRVGGVLFNQRISVHDALHARLEIVRGMEARRETQERCDGSAHQSGQMEAILIWTCGNGVGFRKPWERMALRRRRPSSSNRTSTVLSSWEKIHNSGTPRLAYSAIFWPMSLGVLRGERTSTA